jgi:hypothetical protein
MATDRQFSGLGWAADTEGVAEGAATALHNPSHDQASRKPGQPRLSPEKLTWRRTYRQQ